jgi:hypothetical protein
LVGGLALVYGIVMVQGWETVVGLIALVAGVTLLAIKIIRRNTPTPQ